MPRSRHWYDYPRARRTRSAAIIAAMDRVNRHRPLTDDEVDELIGAIQQERQNAKRRPHLQRLVPRESSAP